MKKENAGEFLVSKSTGGKTWIGIKNKDRRTGETQKKDSHVWAERSRVWVLGSKGRMLEKGKLLCEH